MGTSYVSGRDVFRTFTSKLPATLLLTALSVLATVMISIPLGVLAAVFHDGPADYILRFFSFIGNSMPNFFVAMLLMQFLSIKLGLLPIIASGTDLRSAVMPTLTLAIAMSAKYMRQVRATVLEELNKDYVTGARARGVRDSVILWKSVIKASMLTIITLLALSIGSLLGGTAIVENIFMWDGVGKLAVDAITMRDYPLIQAYVVWMAIIYVAVNLVTVALKFLENPEASHPFTAGLMIAALLLFFSAIFSDSIYYHEKYRFGIRDAAASCGFLLIGAAIMLLVCSMIYGFLIGALIAACGNFVMLLMKYKGVWAK